MVPAPVNYQARDFILHLFSRLCDRLLELRRMEGVQVDSPFTHEPASSTKRLVETLNRKRSAFFVIGAASIFLGLLFGFAELEADRAKPGMPQVTAVSQPAQASAGTDAPASGVAQETTNDLWRGVRAFATAFGLSPMPLVLLGALIAGLPAASLWSYSIYSGQSVDTLLLMRATEGDKDLPPADLSAREGAPSEDDLAELARRNAIAIKFQQTFTSGWSGGLKIPTVGLNANVSHSRSLAALALSLPEIVSMYREFVSRLKEEYRVLIGIDELDKMATDDEAKRFLNDIKVLFGIEGCFYLLSVSESAMSRFERRGLAFRDEFDSSLDEVLRVNYLNFARASELIKRRVVGMPKPFMALGYCISGGLPRDMIRICREIVSGDETEAIEETCKRVLTEELRGKRQAVQIALQEVHLEAEAADLMRTLEASEPDKGNTTPSVLFNDGQKLFDCAQNIATRIEAEKDASGGEAEQRRSYLHILRRLSEELATYLLYCSTLRHLFGADLDESRFDALEGNKTWDQIAASRQAFPVNLGHARSTLEQIRQQVGLSPTGFKVPASQ
jgi:hypothetical protein